MTASFRNRLGFLALLALAGAGSCESPLPTAPNTPLALRFWADVSPKIFSLSGGSSAIRVRVYVENPGDDPVEIRSGGPPYVFTSDPSNSKGLEQSFRFARGTDSLNAGPGADYWGDSVYVIPPRHAQYTETVITATEWRTRGWSLVPGPLRVRGWYNGHEGASALLMIVP